MTADRARFVERLEPWLAGLGFARLDPDASDPVARAALEALAGLPPYEAVHSIDLGAEVVLFALLFGERVAGLEVMRRAEMLHRRSKALSARLDAPVCALQLVVYERAVPAEERAFVLGKARQVPLLFGSARVASWVVALAEPAVHARRLPGWPREMSAQAMARLLD